ncbi:DUF6777 domain-containing protein, partial [Streptomyces resistomycificus]
MRKPTGTLVAACALSAAFLVAGCAAAGGEDTEPSGELLLQPAAAQGPDPFTDSTAAPTAPSPALTRTTQPGPSAETGVRSLSGGTPGLYGGTARVASCDVARQADHLTRDPARARAFAEAEGISLEAIPDFLRGLAPVVLRADTRVTNHGYREGRTTSYQSVLQAGTAVLVDNRGLPRVRCACGNPLKPPAVTPGNPGTGGRAWPGYLTTRMVAVVPTPQVVTDVTIIDPVHRTWIERRIGHDVRHDRVVPVPTPPAPTPDDSASGTSPSGSPTDESASPGATDCVTPTPTVAPESAGEAPVDLPTGTPTATPTVTPTTDLPTGALTDTPTGPLTDTPTGLPTWEPPTEPTDCPTGTVPGTPTATPPPT